MTFTELYNELDILNDQIRIEKNINILKYLIYKQKLVRKTISNKQKKVIKQIQKQIKNEKLQPKDWSFK